MKIDNLLLSFEEAINRPAIHPRAASNGTTHMPTDPLPNENHLPEAAEYDLSAELSKFKRERLLIDERLGSQDDDLASRLRTFVTFAFIEHICTVFRDLALKSLELTAEELKVIEAVNEGKCDQSLYLLQFCGRLREIDLRSGKVPLISRIEISVWVGLVSLDRDSQSSAFPRSAAERAVKTRNNIVHPPLEAVDFDYAAVEALLHWFLSSLNAMLDCPESRATFLSSKRPGERGDVVLSRREIAERERSERWKAFIVGKKPCDIVKGVVKNLTFSCAHVELDGMDGPVRISREGVEKEKHVVKLDEEFEARVVKPNERERCIDLTIEGANYSARLATYSEQASISLEDALREACLGYRPTP